MDRIDVVALTRALIDIPSISGEEHAVTAFLSELLAARGYDVQRQHVVDGRENLYASRGPADLVFSTHTDTVPPHIRAREDADVLYGRGACDAKGALAAMIAASERLRDGGEARAGLLFVVGEEAGSPGARAANRLPVAPRFLVNGEPTDSKIATGSKGALRLRLRCTGRAAHSAYPARGESAIDTLLDVLADLRRIPWPRDPILGDTTFNIGTIRGGVAANVIPPEADAELMFRLVTGADAVLATVRETVAGRADLSVSFACDPVRLAEIDGFERTVVSYTTDIPLLSNWGVPVLFGPGSILDAHTDEEQIRKTELADAVEAYVAIARALLTR